MVFLKRPKLFISFRSEQIISYEKDQFSPFYRSLFFSICIYFLKKNISGIKKTLPKKSSNSFAFSKINNNGTPVKISDFGGCCWLRNECNEWRARVIRPGTPGAQERSEKAEASRITRAESNANGGGGVSRQIDKIFRRKNYRKFVVRPTKMG